MALRFILNNPTVSTLIPGMRKVKNVEENLRASEEGPLPVDLHAELRKHRWERRRSGGRRLGLIDSKGDAVGICTKKMETRHGNARGCNSSSPP